MTTTVVRIDNQGAVFTGVLNVKSLGSDITKVIFVGTT
jgi:hypothetical protein